MSRLPAIDRTKLDPSAQKIWDKIMANRTGAAMRGPSAMLMHVPNLADRVFTLEDYFRSPEAELPPADRELVILATVREMGAKFAWARHEARGKEEGVRSEVIETLRKQGDSASLNPHEKLLVDFARTLIRTRDLPQELYDRAHKELGQTQLIEVVALIGQYNLVGFVIKSFDIQEDSPTF